MKIPNNKTNLKNRTLHLCTKIYQNNIMHTQLCTDDMKINSLWKSSKIISLEKYLSNISPRDPQIDHNADKSFPKCYTEQNYSSFYIAQEHLSRSLMRPVCFLVAASHSKSFILQLFSNYIFQISNFILKTINTSDYILF